MKRKIRQIERRLTGKFGRRGSPHHSVCPVDNLILTILSQNTNDSLRDRAFSSLKKRFKTLEAISRAPLNEVEKSIKIAGLSRQKGGAIKEVLDMLIRDRGEISLDFFHDMETDEGMAYLKSVKGIGDKTAAIVMLFSFDRKTFPVDTHVQRIMKRIGIVPEGHTPEMIRNYIEPHLEEGRAASFHLNLISLGKEICRAANPLCISCPLLALCTYGSNRVGGVP